MSNTLTRRNWSAQVRRRLARFGWTREDFKDVVSFDAFYTQGWTPDDVIRYCQDIEDADNEARDAADFDDDDVWWSEDEDSDDEYDDFTDDELDLIESSNSDTVKDQLDADLTGGW